MGALRIIGYLENCKLMVEPFRSNLQTTQCSLSSLIAFGSYETQIYHIPQLVFTDSALKSNSFDSIVLFFDNMP